MTEDQRELLEKAQSSLAAAKHRLTVGFPGYAASRASYAMFYVAEAFLEGEGLSSSKHSGVIGLFGHHFAHAGRVPVAFHRILLNAQELRIESDYGDERAVTEAKAREQITHAEEFLALAEQKIGAIPSQT